MNTLVVNREGPISCGKLVKIGGSFRIPEVMERARCNLVDFVKTWLIKDFTSVDTVRVSLLDTTPFPLKHLSPVKIRLSPEYCTALVS